MGNKFRHPGIPDDETIRSTEFVGGLFLLIFILAVFGGLFYFALREIPKKVEAVSQHSIAGAGDDSVQPRELKP